MFDRRKETMQIKPGILGLLAIGITASSAAAQTTTSSPAETKAVQLAGGASAISETHGSWTVNCQIVNNTRVCSSSFQQFDGKNQRVFAIEVSPRESGASGNAALPFGLALNKGVILVIDDKPVGETRQFSTCLLLGCLIPLSFDAASLDALNRGNTLKLKAVASDTGKEIEFSVPLKGFSSALKRSGALLAE
jgi:invasion protein IalB